MKKQDVCLSLCQSEHVFMLLFTPKCSQLSGLSDYHLVALCLLSVSFTSPSRYMKGRLVCHNRGLTILHSFSNPHPSLPCLFSPLSSPSFPSDWTPFFLRGCLWSLCLSIFFSPPSPFAQLALPKPRGKIIIWLCTVDVQSCTHSLAES